MALYSRIYEENKSGVSGAIDLQHYTVRRKVKFSAK